MEVGEREGRQANSPSLTTPTRNPCSLRGSLHMGSLGRGTLLVASQRLRLRSSQSHLQGLSCRETFSMFFNFCNVLQYLTLFALFDNFLTKMMIRRLLNINTYSMYLPLLEMSIEN
jgi:hypothetical protein